MTSPAELNEAQQQINAAREQTHTNIAVAEGWAELAQSAAEASGSGSAQAAAAEANRAEQARALALSERQAAETARTAAEAAKTLAETARTSAQTAASTIATTVATMKSEIIGGAGPAFDTLAELKAAYETADQSLTALIAGKANTTDPRFTDARTPTAHTHTKVDVGLANVDNTSDTNKPISTAVQAALTPLQARDVAPATWLWAGTTLPTAASQVHTQARVGDFIVAPNLTTSPGWHQITGV